MNIKRTVLLLPDAFTQDPTFSILPQPFNILGVDVVCWIYKIFTKIFQLSVTKITHIVISLPHICVQCKLLPGRMKCWIRGISVLESRFLTGQINFVLVSMEHTHQMLLILYRTWFFPSFDSTTWTTNWLWGGKKSVLALMHTSPQNERQLTVASEPNPTCVSE